MPVGGQLWDWPSGVRAPLLPAIPEGRASGFEPSQSTVSFRSNLVRLCLRYKSEGDGLGKLAFILPSPGRQIRLDNCSSISDIGGREAIINHLRTLRRQRPPACTQPASGLTATLTAKPPDARQPCRTQMEWRLADGQVGGMPWTPPDYYLRTLNQLALVRIQDP